MKGGGKVQVKAPEDTAAVPVKFQAFIKEEVLVNIYNVNIRFFFLVLSLFEDIVLNFLHHSLVCRMFLPAHLSKS